MKKFNFSLQKVLDYRKQLLEVERNKLKLINAKILDIKQKRTELNREYETQNSQFEKDAKNGLQAMEYQTRQDYLTSLLEKDSKLLSLLKKIEKQQKEQTKVVIRSNQNALILERLRDKKIEEYNKDMLKDVEKMIDEFIN
ncbi:MAG: flagellar export protein FliJ, partial [Oscillospiraceae bacterium]